MDELGIEHLVSRLEHYAATYDEKYKPAAILLKMRDEELTFY